jgi:hypothetical protein
MSVTNLLPWYVWILWGVISVPIVLYGVIKGKDIPFAWRLCGIPLAGLSILVALENSNKGLGFFSEYMWLMKFSGSLLVVAFLLFLIGGYQRENQPGVSPEERREGYLTLIFIILLIISIGFLIGWQFIFKRLFPW